LRKILNFNHKYSFVDLDGLIFSNSKININLKLLRFKIKFIEPLAGGIGAGGVAAKTVKVEGSLIKNEVKMVDNVVGKDSAQNVANYGKLKQDLAFEEKSSRFNTDGTLTDDAINESEVIIKNLGNDNISSDWQKSSTKNTPKQTHFNQNKNTDEIDYGTDYKTVINDSAKKIPNGVKVEDIMNGDYQ
jgi:hypothetical protein